MNKTIKIEEKSTIEEGIDFKVPFIIFTIILGVWVLAISLIGYIIYSLI